MSVVNCRFCKTPVNDVLIDMGMSPLANNYLTGAQISRMEPFYPLCLKICRQCLLVQLDEVESPANIFTDYAYFSSYSNSWLLHCREFADLSVDRFKLNSGSRVVELASNDGYLLQYFLKKKIPVLGVEPAANVAIEALQKGIPTVVKFFGQELAQQLAGEEKKADLLIGNNVLAHVPDLNDFVKGMKILLKEHGVISMEFPHLLQLMIHTQFDTIYHEHFSYFSFSTVQQIFSAHGLTVFDVEEHPTHGGSLRIYAKHTGSTTHPATARVSDMMAKEEREGLTRIEYYSTFAKRVRERKISILDFIGKAKLDGKSIVGFGAPAKGNTLLNYCGLKSDFIDYSVDDTPAKQGRFLPGTHIPVYPAKKLKETKPDYVVIMPWNFKDEIMEKHGYIRDWKGRFVVLIPEVKVISEF